MNDNIDYIRFWCEELSITTEQAAILDVYTALFCLDFMGEIGQRFNQEAPESIDKQWEDRLSEILETLI